MNKEIILPKVDIFKTCPTSVSGPQTNGRSKARFLILIFYFYFLCSLYIVVYKFYLQYYIIYLAEIKVLINHDMTLLDIDTIEFLIMMDRN